MPSIQGNHFFTVVLSAIHSGLPIYLLSYVSNPSLNYFVFLRLAKNKPAAAIMIKHPPIVKIVVPIPPVPGRAESLVSVILTAPERVAAV